MNQDDIVNFNLTYKSATDLLKAVNDELTPEQIKSLALDLIWEIAVKSNKFMTAKKIVLQAKLRG